MSVLLAARRRQVAPPTSSDASDIGYRAPMNGKVGATCRPPAASCTSRIFRCIRYWLSGTDEWKCRCNLPPAGGKLHLAHFPMHRISAIGHRWVETSVQLAARRRQVAPSAFSDAPDIGYISGTDHWKSRCNLPPAGGKLHLPHFPMHRILAIGHHFLSGRARN